MERTRDNVNMNTIPDDLWALIAYNPRETYPEYEENLALWEAECEGVK